MIGTSVSRIGVAQVELSSDRQLHGLRPAFQRLNERLKTLVAASSEASQFASDSHPYPGLVIDKNEIQGWLERDCAGTASAVEGALVEGPLFDQTENGNSKILWLATEYGLAAFDLDVILIALATELDLRYEKVFAYLQDDITRKLPSLDLTLTLLCPTSAREEGRKHFAPNAPLIRHNLLQLVRDPDGRSKLASQLKLDETVINLLLNSQGLNSSVRAFCQLVDPAISLTEAPIDHDLKKALQFFTAQKSDQALKLHFLGGRGTGRRQTAEALAAQVNSKLLVVDTEYALTLTPDPGECLSLILREARFRQAVVYLENLDFLLSEARTVTGRRFFKAVREAPGMVILAGEKPLDSSTGIQQVQFPVPEFAQRKRCWEDSLQQRGVVLDSDTLIALAGSFRLSPGEIEIAIAAAIDRARWRSARAPAGEGLDPAKAQPTATDFFACARTRLNHDLARFARQIDPKYEWRDLVLPEDQLSQLRELCTRHHYQSVIYDEWGFGRKLSLGRGLNALFSGHPGTGKTMAAEVIAGQLHLALYKVDLSQVVSKYIGETEKSLNRIFQEALNSSAILFFDEADALFGKRTDVKDAHDRYANIEVSYLLQKMEEYDGIAILATNLRQNIDVAFLRRMQFIVEFPFPDEEHRKRIWEVVFPREAPIAGDVDFALLARSIRLAGGNLKSIGLAAAFYAASDGGVIQQRHLMRAARREFQKLGQSWNESDRHKEERLAARASSSETDPR